MSRVADNCDKSFIGVKINCTRVDYDAVLLFSLQGLTGQYLTILLWLRVFMTSTV